MTDARLNNFRLLSNCLYIDIDDAQEHFTIKLIFAIFNYK